MRTVYVYSAVPPNSKGTIEEYGLLSGVEVAKNKEILKLARPTKKSREDFVKKVEATAASDRPYSVLGPSVLFTMPDESKITDKHFIKEWGLIPVRINLSKLMEDYPETMIWGAELLPYKGKWRKLSDKAFDRKIEQEYGLTWEEFLEARSHELTLANVRKYSKMQPKTLWSNYERQHIGKYYAANVPHAFIVTPMGTIPYEYIEFIDTRQNPYPYYVDCDDAFADLLKAFEPNVEVQKKFALELFDSLGEVLEDYDWDAIEENVEELVDTDLFLSLRTEEDYLRLIRQKIKQAKTLDSLQRWASIIWPVLPLYFLAQDFEVIEDVEFVHYIPLDRLASVKEQGFYGRATVGKMTWTRMIKDSYIKENGYFFAYDKKMIEAGTPTVVSEKGRIEGIASKAISFYMSMDGETQLIIPFKCVSQYEILPKDLPKEDLKKSKRMAEMFPKFDPLDYEIDRERKNPRANPYSGIQTLFHCSPTVIDKIDPYYGSADFYGTLFFANSPYSPGDCSYVYKIHVNDNDLIHIHSLEPTDDELQEIVRMVDIYCDGKINKDQAYDLLTEIYSGSLFVDYLGGHDYFHNKLNGYECVGEFQWWLQGHQARVARRMGYFGAESEDENGYVVMADMVGREHLLNDYLSVENEDYDEWLDRENPLDEYTQVVATQEGDVFGIDSSSGDIIDDLDISSDLGDPSLVAKRADIYITRDKIFLSGYVHRDKLVAVLFVTDHNEDCFSFDIAVLPEYQGKGLGSRLLDIAIREFDNQKDMLDLEDYDYCITVVNPLMKTMLEDRGFFVDEDYFDTQMWMMRKEERENPYLESENGKIVNPETNDIIWYHGSWFGKLDRLKAYNPRQYYDATYFSSSEKLANEFATGEMAWLGYDEKVPRMKRSGYLHFVNIDDVKLLDSDKIFSDKEELLLTNEGAIFVQTLSDLGVEDHQIEKWLFKFRKGKFHAFIKSDPIFPHLIRVMENLGYRGWFEREFTKDDFEAHINIALLYPDEDAKLVGGHIVKRTRKF